MTPGESHGHVTDNVVTLTRQGREPDISGCEYLEPVEDSDSVQISVARYH